MGFGPRGQHCSQDSGQHLSSFQNEAVPAAPAGGLTWPYGSRGHCPVSQPRTCVRERVRVLKPDLECPSAQSSRRPLLTPRPSVGATPRPSVGVTRVGPPCLFRGFQYYSEQER